MWTTITGASPYNRVRLWSVAGTGYSMVRLGETSQGSGCPGRYERRDRWTVATVSSVRLYLEIKAKSLLLDRYDLRPVESLTLIRKARLFLVGRFAEHHDHGGFDTAKRGGFVQQHHAGLPPHRWLRVTRARRIHLVENSTPMELEHENHVQLCRTCNDPTGCVGARWDLHAKNWLPSRVGVLVLSSVFRTLRCRMVQLLHDHGIILSLPPPSFAPQVRPPSDQRTDIRIHSTGERVPVLFVVQHHWENLGIHRAVGIKRHYRRVANP